MTHRIGIIGLGMAATKHALALRDLRERAEVAGVWSPSPQRRADFGAKFELPVADSAEALFDDPSIGLLLILTPPWTHLDLVSRSAAIRKHVLLEKPVEATLARSEELVRIAEAAGITLALVFQNRFRAPYARLAELVHAGRLGRPISVAVSMRWWRADSYFAENGRGTVAKDGGGALLNQGIHIIDQLIDLLGPVQAVSGFQAISGLRRIDTEDAAVASLRWANGAVGTLDATTTAFPGLPERIDLTGELGSASLERARLRVWLKDGTVLDEQEDASLPQVKADYLAHRSLIEDMLDALDQGRQPLTNGRASLAAHALIDAMLRSNGSARVELV